MKHVSDDQPITVLVAVGLPLLFLLLCYLTGNVFLNPDSSNSLSLFSKCRELSTWSQLVFSFDTPPDNLENGKMGIFAFIVFGIEAYFS